MKTEKKIKKVRFSQFSKILNSISKNELLDSKDSILEKNYLLAPLKIKKYKSKNSTIFTERLDDTSRFSLKHKFKDLLKLFSKNAKNKIDLSIEKKGYFLKKKKILKENLHPKLVIDRKSLIFNSKNLNINKIELFNQNFKLKNKKISFTKITKNLQIKKIFNNFEKKQEIKKFCIIIFRTINNKDIILKQSLKNNHKLLQNQIGFFLNENFEKFLNFIKNTEILNLIYKMLIVERIVIICLFTIFKDNPNIIKFVKVILNVLKDNWIIFKFILFYELKINNDLNIDIFKKVFCKNIPLVLEKDFNVDKSVKMLEKNFKKIEKNYKTFKKSYPVKVNKKFSKILKSPKNCSINKTTIKIYRYLALYSIKIKNLTKVPQKNLLQKKYFITENRKISKKLTLVLDMDETLIHYDVDTSKAYNRPYLQKFLQTLSKYYELIIFTAGKKYYADEVINNFDKNKLIDFRLYRKHTDLVDGVNIKNLSKIGRNLKSIIIIDNIKENFSLQKCNGIFIEGFYGEENDRELFKLLNPLLRFLIRYTKKIFIYERRKRC